MITLFSTCKAFRGSSAIHQVNALTSWHELDAEVMIFGEEAGVWDICKSLGYRQMTRCSQVDAVPLLDEIFNRAQKAASNDYLVYSNGDIVIVDGLEETICRINEEFPNFLAVCRRWDVELDEYLDFDKDWRRKVKRRIKGTGELHSTCSSDIFAFKRPLWELPAFSVGMPGWDNWMMWRATAEGWPVVDMTPVVTLAHPRHGYGPNMAETYAHRWWCNHPLAMRNADLLGRGRQYCYKHVAEAGYLWRIDDKGIFKVEREAPG